MQNETINILGVDDKAENLLALEMIVEDLDVNLVRAFSGEEALALLEMKEFALILMDVRMPGLDGYETAELIRRRLEDRQIPIIFITAVNREERHVFKGYVSGAVDYLSKPIDPEVLKKKVGIFLELHRQKRCLSEKAAQLESANRRISLQQQALADSEVRFRTAFEQSFQFMAILDSQGKVVELNELAKKLCGDYRGEIVGQYLWNICWIGQYEENQRLQEVICRAAMGEPICDEARFTDIDGRIHFLSRSISPVTDESGRVVYITFQGHDITSRVQAENEKHSLELLLQQAQKMEALGALAGGIAHDFNNVLSVIIGNADLAEKNCTAASPLRMFIQRIREAGDKAKDLVRQILSFSRQAEIEKVVVQPSKIILESVTLLRSSIPTTIDIEHDIDSDCGAVLADPTQYHQIIMNLCTNAFHAMESCGGKLTIRLREQWLEGDGLFDELEGRPGSYAHLSVADSGSGIDQKTMAKIFDPYFTTKEKGKGTGMGLAIVHGIVKGHGGAVRVESRADAGAVFHVYLPLAENSIAKQEEVFETLVYGSEHILLIDDEEMLLEMEKNMLELMGYRVTAMNCSRRALEYFCDHAGEVDLVVTDQTMPGMTGMDLARRILSLKADMPVILCTGYSPNISKRSVREIGIRNLAYKPLALEELSKIIRRTIDGDNGDDAV